MDMCRMNRPGANQILIWTVMILTVITTTDTVVWGTNSNILWPKLVQSCIILTAILLALESIGRKRKIPLKKIIVLILMGLLVFLTGLANDDLRFGYIYKISLFVFSLFITEYIKIEKFAVYFDKIIYFLALVSLVGFVVIYFYPAILKYSHIVTNTGGNRFYNFWLFVVDADGSYLRNYSIFREPGVYQMYLIIACLFQLYFLPVCNLKKLLIYSLALITTFSTTGYIAFVITVFLALVKYPSIIKKRKALTGIFIIGFCCILFAISFWPWILSFAQPVFAKFSAGDTAFVSFFSRKASLIVNFHLWMDEPLFGVGLTKIDNLFPVLSEELLGVYISSNTNTFLVQLAAHGLFYCGIWIWGFMRGAFLTGKNVCERFLIVGIIIVLSIGQNLTFCPVANVLLWYCLFGKSKKQNSLRKLHSNSVLNAEAYI